MKAAWNKFVQKSDKESLTSKPQILPVNLQKKYSKGVQYNMKVVIKGDHNVGKTCLFERLQGLRFTGEYQETEAIQIAAIQWNYKNTDDVVKVEIWDIVDKAKKRVLQDKLKTENSEEVNSGVALDAEFIDVYKGTNGVILVFDITKKWTFDYVQKEIAKIPGHIPVLILGNRCDQGHHRTVGVEEPKYFVENLDRSSSTRYAEASMYNGFGLKFLYKWFNLPFLQLQHQTLLGQLDTNKRETDVTTYELDVYEQTDESNYDLFLEKLSAKRRSNAEHNSNIQSIVSPSVPALPSNMPQGVSTQAPYRQTSMEPVGRGQPIVPKESIGRGQPILPSGSAMEEIPTPVQVAASSTVASLGSDLKLASLEDFVPDDSDNVSRAFLADSHLGDSGAPAAVTADHEDSESDADEQGNPLVADFDDRVEETEYIRYPTMHLTDQNQTQRPINVVLPSPANPTNLNVDQGESSSGDEPEDPPYLSGSREDTESTPMKQNTRKKKRKEKKRKKSEKKDDELEEFLNDF